MHCSFFLRGDAALLFTPIAPFISSSGAMQCRLLPVNCFFSLRADALSFNSRLICCTSLRGDAGARVAEGWLGPGEGAHVLEANAMAMSPSLSFKVPDR